MAGKRKNGMKKWNIIKLMIPAASLIGFIWLAYYSLQQEALREDMARRHSGLTPGEYAALAEMVAPAPVPDNIGHLTPMQAMQVIDVFDDDRARLLEIIDNSN